jgi:hypothetical protein
VIGAVERICYGLIYWNSYSLGGWIGLIAAMYCNCFITHSNTSSDWPYRVDCWEGYPRILVCATSLTPAEGADPRIALDTNEVFSKETAFGLRGIRSPRRKGPAVFWGSKIRLIGRSKQRLVGASWKVRSNCSFITTSVTWMSPSIQFDQMQFRGSDSVRTIMSRTICHKGDKMLSIARRVGFKTSGKLQSYSTT